MSVKLSDRVIRGIEAGNATLFLGAGASAVACDQHGKNLPTGSGLSAEIKQLFGYTRAPSSLSMLSELVGTADFPRLVRFVVDRFSNAQLSNAHKMIPWFNWKAIVTTNYDSLIESAYTDGITLQNPRRIVEEQDLSLIGDNDVPIIKLHGCVNQTNTIVLSMSNLYERKRKAELLFNLVEQLHILGPVIYIGYSLADQHIVEWIFELTRRLGPYRQPVVFVGRKGTDKWKRDWIKNTLNSEFISTGFKEFMELLCKDTSPPIGPSKIIGRPFSPCKAREFAGNGKAELEIVEKNGEWECFLEYQINDEEGFAGMIFERFSEPIDITNKTKLNFQVFLSNEPRIDARLEILKLESPSNLYPRLLDISNLERGRWIDQSIKLSEYNKVDLDKLTKIVLADNGHRATLGTTYRVGLRRVVFE